ncbi:hypothetical protein, partial [Stenotrophomonas maltophilia]|uniref:hypothetical protein n=1 Tax=Stenotrophomonas maltophilia TaxID=40324 RepID=UPI0013D96FD3
MTLKDLDLPVGVVARRGRGGYAWTRLTLMVATAAADWMVIAGTSYMVSLVYNRVSSGDWWTVKA